MEPLMGAVGKEKPGEIDTIRCFDAFWNRLEMLLRMRDG